MTKIKVLFVCVHNSARSQMAEAFLNHHGKGKFEAESAGIEAGSLNPLVIESMKEIGIDISGKNTTDVFDLYKEGKLFNYVITVCEKEASEKCPIFIGVTQRYEWSFPDPSKLTGTNEEKLIEVNKIRDRIKIQVIEFINNH